MVVEPRILSRQPSFPCRFNRSVRKYDDSTALQSDIYNEPQFLPSINQFASKSKMSMWTRFNCPLFSAADHLYLTSTLRAPRGVTRVAGAKAYAAKLAASPAPTRKQKKIHMHLGTGKLQQFIVSEVESGCVATI